METRANYLLIGGFTLAGFLGLLGFLMWFAGNEMNRQYDYYQVVFPEISGISAGTAVQFSGVPAGQIIDLALDADGRVRVRLELREGTPVRTTSIATMVPQGITGLSILSLSSGTPGTPLLREASDQPEPEIRAGRSMLESITESAPQLVEQLSDAATRLNTMLGETNQGHVTAILQNVERATGRLETAVDDVADATGAIAEVAAKVQDFAAAFDGLAPRIEGALDSARKAGDRIDSAGQAIETVRFAEISAEIEAILADLRAVLGAEDAAALPRNLSETLKSASALLDDLHQGRAADHLNAALQSAKTAADGLNAAIAPAMARLGRAADSTATAMGSLTERGALQTDLRQMMRDIGRAAAAFGSMARTIERKPNALIMGR